MGTTTPKKGAGPAKSAASKGSASKGSASKGSASKSAGAGGSSKGSAAAKGTGASSGGRAPSSARAAALRRLGKRSLAMDAAAPRADLQKLVDDVNRESRQRMRDKWGFDIESEQPVGGSNWKYTQLKP